MKRSFDEARHLKPLNPGDMVWIPKHEAGGTVVRESNTRSYIAIMVHSILMPDGTGTQSSEAKTDQSDPEPPV